MKHVVIDDVDPSPYDQEIHANRRPLADSLQTAGVAITHYVLEPGERFSGSVHAHFDQEEVFVILEGEATFETRARDADSGVEAGDDDRAEITVGENEAIRFAPGEFQSGRNDGDERVVALALGAPRESEDVRISRIPVLDDRDIACPECETDHMRISRAEGVDFECPDCGATLALDLE